MKRICDFCKVEFETKNKHKRFCSKCCSAKFTNGNPTRKKELSDKCKKYWNDHKDELTERSNKIKESWSDEHRNAQAERMKEKWSDPLEIKKLSDASKEMWKDSEYKEKMSNVSLEIWKNTETRDILTKKRKEIWQDPDYKNKMQEIHKNSWTSERIEHHRNIFIEKWKDIDWVSDRLAKTHGNYKDFILPSGKTVKLQGYEPQALKNLLEEYVETDIVIGIKNINECIGKITYIEKDGVEHRYYPDFYVKSENAIIEVKSQWTYEKWKERNELKKQACLDKGFKFRFIIIDK